MPSEKHESRFLYPFEFHGVDFTSTTPGETGQQSIGTCPFCGKEDHFFVNESTGQWDCKCCGKSGNQYTFLAEIAKSKDEATRDDWEKLQKWRGGLPKWAYEAFGVRMFGGRWIFPIRNYKGTVVDLRTCRPGGKFFSTKGMRACLGNANLLADEARSDEPVYICEGEWDAAALYYLLKKTGRKGIVTWVPGAGMFKEDWVMWFRRRKVYLLYDNDRPGLDGMKRAAMISQTAASVMFIHWPSSKNPGYDINDYVSEVIHDDKPRKSAMKELLSLCKTYHPDEKINGKPQKSVKKKPAISFDDLLVVFRKWLEMSDDFIDALKVCLATVLSNQIGGDPLWVFIVGPPGSGKTAALMAFKDADNCVFESTITPHALVSGWMGTEDPSLIPKLDGKVFVLKDYTEIIAMNSIMQEEVLAILRGAYDGHVKKMYGNGVVREYESHFSMLAGVTSAIHGNSKASLGERFIKFQLMYDTNFNASDQIRAALANIAKEEMMTEELRDAVNRFLSREINLKKIGSMVPQWVTDRVIALSQIIAALRARVEREQYSDAVRFRPQIEVGTRLAKQIVKLGIALAIVEGKSVIDADTYRIMERVAFDTAIGFHLDLVQAMMECGGTASRDTLCREANVPMTNMFRAMDDLVMLEVVKKSEPKKGRLNRVKYEFAVTAHIRKLWEQAKVGQRHIDRMVASKRHRYAKTSLNTLRAKRRAAAVAQNLKS